MENTERYFIKNVKGIYFEFGGYIAEVTEPQIGFCYAYTTDNTSWYVLPYLGYTPITSSGIYSRNEELEVHYHYIGNTTNIEVYDENDILVNPSFNKVINKLKIDEIKKRSKLERIKIVEIDTDDINTILKEENNPSAYSSDVIQYKIHDHDSDIIKTLKTIINQEKITKAQLATHFNGDLKYSGVFYRYLVTDVKPYEITIKCISKWCEILGYNFSILFKKDE